MAASVAAAASRVNEPGLFPQFAAIGGQQPDVAAAANLCANSGVVGPDGSALSEALAFGLAGGVGFLYGVFEYDDTPTMTIVARNKSTPDPFCEPIFAGAGATIEISTTRGTKKATRELDAVLNEQRPALFTVCEATLPYLGMPAGDTMMAPHLVGLVGGADGVLLIDDRSPVPIPVNRDDFDSGRVRNSRATNRMITIGAVDRSHNWKAALTQAVEAGAVGYDTPPVPQFASNVGHAGLQKFERLLSHPKDAKSWRRVFASSRRAAIGLTRLHDCIEYAYTAPSAGREMQAEFLTEASAVTGEASWVEAAGIYRDSARQWARLASAATSSHPSLSRHAELSEERAKQLKGRPDRAAMSSFTQKQEQLVFECDITADVASDVFDELSSIVSRIIELEQAALTTLLGGDPPST